MPIPPIAIKMGSRAALILATAAVRAWEDRRTGLGQSPPQAGFPGGSIRLLLLGKSEVGKTTLINTWRGCWTADDPGRTHAKEEHGPINVVVGTRHLRLAKVVDVSGLSDAWDTWRSEVGASRCVIYLVNAEALLAEELRRPGQPVTLGWTRIEDDAGQISRSTAGAVELYLIVVTHRDLDPRFARLGEDRYHRRVAGQLEPIVFKLGGDHRVQVITGSLETLEAATRTAAKVLERLP